MTKLKTVRDEELLRRLAELVAQANRNTAELLAYLAEVEERNLHLAQGYDSMKSFCVGALHMSEDAAIRRVTAAHTACKFPILLDALADGRIHLSAIGLLGACLTPSNADELVAAVTHRSNAEIREILVCRFPEPEPLRLDDGISPQVVVPQQPNPIGVGPDRVAAPTPAVRTRIEPISRDRFRMELSIARETHDKLRRIQALLGHTLPSGKVEDVLDRALDLALAQLEKQKFAKVDRPRAERPIKGVRTIPAHVRRAVYERDAGRCAWVGQDGHRCGSTQRLEFDHVVPLARGGSSTAGNLRLLCRIHNQYAAEALFGREFMEAQRGRRALPPTAAGCSE
jgi:5-methylcytosine-specific restriction endonuclease McrA